MQGWIYKLLNIMYQRKIEEIFKPLGFKDVGDAKNLLLSTRTLPFFIFIANREEIFF